MTAPSDLDAAFVAKLAEMRQRKLTGRSLGAVQGLSEREARGNLWLAHRWPEKYGERCVHIRGRWVCRRCSVLYPIGVVVATLFAAGVELWPRSWDMTAIWVLCIPGTVAYCGEAVGLFTYRARWQSLAMAITAVGFGRGLGYEFLERWSGQFWWPVTVFGGLWFAATVIGSLRTRAGR